MAERRKHQLDEAAVRFLQVAENYTWFIPHLSLRLTWNRDEVVRDDHEDDGEPTFVERTEPLSLNINATDSTWKKWRPSDPTSPHWYGHDQLARLIAANIAYAEDTETPCPTILAFIREFRGLSSTGRAKAICDGVGAERQSLATFYGDGKDHSRIELLLAKMREASRPVKPKDLGVIGKEHFAAKFEAAGVDLESFDYRCAPFEYEGLPYVAEFAFGYCPDEANARRIITGVNWGVSIGADPFRRLGPGGESISAILYEQRANINEPIVVALHLACPQISYLDRGKSSVNIPGADHGENAVGSPCRPGQGWFLEMGSPPQV